MPARGDPALLAGAETNRAGRNISEINHANHDDSQKRVFIVQLRLKEKWNFNGIFHALG